MSPMRERVSIRRISRKSSGRSDIFVCEMHSPFGEALSEDDCEDGISGGGGRVCATGGG